MLKNLTCLVIDDDQDDQEIFLMCIHKISTHIECTTKNNGVDALCLLESDIAYIPDFIFIDVNMPKMNGIDCLKKLKTIDRLSETKIYMYSTTSETATVNETAHLGADGFLMKPAKTAELKEKLIHIFNLTTVITD